MVSLRELLQEELVIEEMTASDKAGVIREFAELLQSTGRVRAAEEISRILLDREALGSTGIGDGVAIPHGKLRGLNEMIVALGISSRGVDFQSLDNKPVHIFFLLVTPQDNPGIHLKILSRISRILKNPDLREGLRRAVNRRELRMLVCAEDGKYVKNEP